MRNLRYFGRVRCVDGLGKLRTYPRAVAFIINEMKTDSPELRRDVLVRILERTAPLEASLNDGDYKRFDEIAREVYRELISIAERSSSTTVAQ